MSQRTKMIIGLAALAILGFMAFGYKSCEEPTPLEVRGAMISCAMELVAMPIEELVSNVCTGIGKAPNCELDEMVDGPKVEKFINGQVKSCVSKKLETKNLCTDKIDSYLRE